jgi:dTDP-4-amino-4,6-dideoxygalactose transaminase
VFTTNFSFFATAEAISLVGATPIFIDIEESTFNINPELLELEINKVIKDGKLNARAIISVDLFGLLADYNAIEKISKKFNLFLIEDAAQSFGATYNNKKACSFGNASATSFYPAKPLGCYGDGGAIFTDNDSLAEICKSIRVHGEGKDKYHNIRIGLNSRLDTIQATILLNKMKIFNEELKLRNLVAKEYSKKLPNNVKIQHIPKGFISSRAQYSILCDNEDERNDIIDILSKKNIPTAVFYKIPFNKNIIYSSKAKNSFPISEGISKCILSLPMHPYLSNEEISTITSLISNYYK